MTKDDFAAWKTASKIKHISHDRGNAACVEIISYYSPDLPTDAYDYRQGIRFYSTRAGTKGGFDPSLRLAIARCIAEIAGVEEPEVKP